MPENDPDLRIETTKYRIVEQAQLNTKLGQAERLLSQGVLQDAEALYRDILNVLPGQPEASHGLGLIALHTGNASAAVELMQMAAIALPGDAKIHTNLGLALATAGDAASAESCYLKAIELEENFVDPHLNLANLLLEAGRTAEAADAYANAERLAEHVLPQYFRHGQYASWVRTLNAYGFKKSGAGRWHHPSFLRGHPELLKNIRRKAPPSRGPGVRASAASSSSRSVSSSPPSERD